MIVLADVYYFYYSLTRTALVMVVLAFLFCRAKTLASVCMSRQRTNRRTQVLDIIRTPALWASGCLAFFVNFKVSATGDKRRSEVGSLRLTEYHAYVYRSDTVIEHVVNPYESTGNPVQPTMR